MAKTDIPVRLVNEDGNAFAILGRCYQALVRSRRCDLWDEFRKEATSGDLQELYSLIGCDLVELIQLDRGIIMAIDEEGKLKEIKGGFTFLGWGTVIAGTGIVLGGNSSKLKALQENLASFEMMTEWVDAADVPPPHAFVTAF